MMKRLLAAEHRAKFHADVAFALKFAFIEQLDNMDLPLEEWECTMKRLELAYAALKGRYDALWQLRFNTVHAVEKDVHESMKDSWRKYYVLAYDLAKKQKKVA